MKIELEELINTIKKELEQSSISKYICEDGTVISTDVGYVEDWFYDYIKVLKKSMVI